ncbi:unnamed protein product [Linum trigynum]|uniref:Uncharacterized protein n=1 Tax=Linum trigynum TaxID=586398 RepID=A0AAV2EG94_9ROSI
MPKRGRVVKCSPEGNRSNASGWEKKGMSASLMAAVSRIGGRLGNGADRGRAGPIHNPAELLTDFPRIRPITNIGLVLRPKLETIG